MKLRVLWVGKTQEEWVRRGIDEYSGRVRRYLALEISEVREEKGTVAEQMRLKEGERLLKTLSKGARLILLDEAGEQFTSTGFAAFLGRERDHGTQELVFAVGGAYGFDDAVRKAAYRTMSLSKMTFTHQMVRPFLLEQIYRGLTILNNESYHH
ncbi:ribosomal RNA large subunit methyltransferase H [Geobacter sp. OR-1]|uniref:23S rRNA (pseudouridine(1915)-N(3))-methyltransferase RlmH n=1 Tax=Geobacter sp. OR-1 TaxID=1266765 RepID=UPI0005433F37|nr:23S rRNA (pseudouridine(1915)-N(3))-methyltransferase RlmH [Geobacter sp. OR-1]GAM10491.1 ribosomal RNA large subunit methyltransferase H [Geobacter sp. OR-1]